MPTRTRALLTMWIAATVALAAVAPSIGAPTPTAAEAEALELLDAALGLDALSGAVWPGWRISQTPFAVYIPDSTCLVVRHPGLPPGFERCGGAHSTATPVYAGEVTDAAVDLNGCRLADVPTAFMRVDEFRGDVLSKVFEKAFYVHLLTACSDLCELLGPKIGYPVNGQSLAMIDIECDVLVSAMSSEDDTLDQRVRDFVGVRSFRHQYTLGRFKDFERKIEFTEGLPLYIAEKCREHAAEHLNDAALELLGESVAASGGLIGCFAAPSRLDWYRRNRLRYSGAAVCALLDRMRPDWRGVCQRRCVAPHTLLVEVVGGEAHRVLGILERHHLKERTVERESFISEAKTGPEQEFERLMRGRGKRLVFTTNLLAAVSISHDPKKTTAVDSHRQLHTSVLKIEFSGGTRVHITGHTVAAAFGTGDFDVVTLIMEMPEEYAVRSDGEDVVLESGINHLDAPFVVEAPGVLVEARVGVVVVGEDRVNFVLHQ